MRKRKTIDVWELWILYPGPHGWEHELTEELRSEILARKREYRDNCPQYPVKRRREKASPEEVERVEKAQRENRTRLFMGRRAQAVQP